MLSLDLSHLFLIKYPQVLANKLWVNSNDLDYFMPKLEQLAADLIEILHQLERYLKWIIQVHSLRKGNN